MRSVEFREYSLSLSTGEEITVSELDVETVPSLLDEAVTAAASAFLSLCTRAPRDAVEDAKSGLPEALEPFLGTPPNGCLLKVRSPACAELRHCAISDRTRCSTVYSLRRKAAFPMCWTAEVPERTPPAVASAARDLADSIVSAWRDGRYVVVAT